MTILNCPNCGGTHYGSSKCPFIEAPCVICGDMTAMACSDCAIDSGGKESVHVCQKSECRDKHERERHPPRAMPPDVTWAHGVTEKVARAMNPEQWRWYERAKAYEREHLQVPHVSHAPFIIQQTEAATAALSASPLPEALVLIERLTKRRVTMADSMAWDAAVADARAFLARVRK